MGDGLKALKKGKFNYMSQERNPDGSVTIILTSRKPKKVYKFRVIDLYGPNEEEVPLE